MEYNQDPFQFLGTLGPPTRPQPQWEGVGYKTYRFDASPVSHVIAPDGAHHQMLRINADNAHLPVERELLGYIRETGYNPAQFNLPEPAMGWDEVGEQFGYPDTRPGSRAEQALPRDATAFASGDVNPLTGSWSRLRDPSHASEPVARPRWRGLGMFRRMTPRPDRPKPTIPGDMERFPTVRF